jgi:putative transcriptional regulator
MLRRLVFIATVGVLLLAAGTATLPGQSGRGVKLAAGQLLVARRNGFDPNFARTVILLARYGQAGAMGLFMNRPSGIPLSQALPTIKAAKDRTEPVYFGGPVGMTGALALLRSRAAPAPGTNIFADVHLISTRTLLEKMLAAGTPASNLRVYMGYAGWGAGQLDMEVGLGWWHVMPADAGMVFDAQPETLWTRLIGRFEGLRAGNNADGPCLFERAFGFQRRLTISCHHQPPPLVLSGSLRPCSHPCFRTPPPSYDHNQINPSSSII